MAHYSSYSVDRIREKRRRSGRFTATVMWAVLLALFVSGGSAWADKPADNNAGGVPSCENSNGNSNAPACRDTTPAPVACGAGFTGFEPNCVPIQVPCGAGFTGFQPNCVPIQIPCGAGFTGFQPNCVAIITPINCEGATHRDPQTNTCVPNGQSDLDHGKSDCEAAGGQWNAQTDPKCTPASVLCTQGGGTWSGERCKSAEEVACEARGGSMDGDCYVHTTTCHKGEDGAYSVIQVAKLTDLDTHLAHGDFAPTAGACVVAETDACPGELNPGVQKSGTTCITASNTNNSSSTPGGANAPAEDPWVDPAVDVDRGNSPLAVGGLAPPQDAEVGGEFIENVRGEAQAGGAAGPLADEDAVLAEGDDLPVTGMSLGSTILAALLAVLFGAFAYGEAARAARRSRAGAPA